MTLEQAELKKRKRKTPNITSFEVQKTLFLADCVCRNLKESTQAIYCLYMDYLKKYLKTANHSLLVEEVGEDDIRKFLDFLRTEKRNSQASINSAIRHLRPVNGQ